MNSMHLYHLITKKMIKMINHILILNWLINIRHIKHILKKIKKMIILMKIS